MGQIVSLAAKPKRCNANQLSQVPTPAAGEHILVSSDNSMNAAGQGEFDAFVIGDGSTLAKNLPLHYFKEGELAALLSLKTTPLVLNWQAGVTWGNTLGASTTVKYALFTPRKGSIVEIKATNTTASYPFFGIWKGYGTTSIHAGDAKPYYTRFVADGSTYALCNHQSYIAGTSVNIITTELQDGEIVRYDDFGDILPIFTYNGTETINGKVEIANQFIKKVEVIGEIENYQLGELRVQQLYYHDRTENTFIAWANQFSLIQNAAQTWLEAHAFNLTEQYHPDEVVTTSAHLRVTWNTAAMWNYGTETSQTIYSAGATASQLVVRTTGDIDEIKKIINPSALGNNSVSYEKLTQEVQEMLNQGGGENVSKGFLTGKVIASLCDSLGAAGIWQSKIAEITGAIFNATLNNNHYSVGGTQSLSVNGNSGQERARMLVEEGEIVPDVIFIESVNEQFNVGTTADEPFFLTSKITLSSITGLESINAARTYWDNNFASIVAGQTPAIGQMLLLPFSTTTFTLTITSAPTGAGTLAIILGGSGTKYVDVAANDTIANVVDKIAEYSYPHYSCAKSGASITFRYLGEETPSLSVDAGTTGVTSTQSTNSTSSNFGTVFLGHDVSKWNTQSQWKYVNFYNYTLNVSLMSIYKGLTEYLQTNFPKAMIYFVIPKTYQFNWDSYRRADGTINYDAVLADCSYQKWLFDGQVSFCEYYEIPYVDLRKISCLTPANLSTFMTNRNVHPKEAAYIRWGEIISQKLN